MIRQVYGDSIDEDSQRVQRQGAGYGGPAEFSGRPGADADAPAMTTSGWRVLKLMADYAELVRILRSEAPKVYSGESPFKSMVEV